MGSTHGLVLDYDILESEFVPQSRNYIYFLTNSLRKDMPPTSSGLNSITTVLLQG